MKKKPTDPRAIEIAHIISKEHRPGVTWIKEKYLVSRDAATTLLHKARADLRNFPDRYSNINWNWEDTVIVPDAHMFMPRNLYVEIEPQTFIITKQSKINNKKQYKMIEKNMLSGVLDIHGKNIKLGDKVKFWRFYRSSMSSEVQFGTESENSWTVHEEFMEFVTGEIIFYLGCFCVKYGKEITSLKDVIERTPIDFVEYYMYDYGGELNYEDRDFWGEDFHEKFNHLPQNIQNSWTEKEHKQYWEIIEVHLHQKCKEFEIIGQDN